MTRLTTLLSIGFLMDKYLDHKAKRNVVGPLYTMTVEIDGVTRHLHFNKETAKLIMNSINTTWKKNL